MRVRQFPEVNLTREQSLLTRSRWFSAFNLVVDIDMVSRVKPRALAIALEMEIGIIKDEEGVCM